VATEAEIKHSVINTNGIRMRVAEQGEGPLVVLCHGWPELWYSWRHQLPALAAAGFRVVAPDMRGYGQTDAPSDVHAYSLLHLVGDMVGLVAALKESEAIIVGHDWGAPVAWTSALFRPDIFRAVAGMSVPYDLRSAAPPIETLRKRGRDNFYYVYFQKPGVAEAEFERDPAATIRRIMYSGSGDMQDKQLFSGLLPPGGGFLDTTLDPERLPSWLTEADLAVFVHEYQRTGFRGGLNWYRNIDPNWELMAPWQDATIQQPALFVAGAGDGVIRGMSKAVDRLPMSVPGLKRKLIIEGAGHWIQQERPAEVNAALIEFLADIRNQMKGRRVA
jgi:pimeloyl-ACP methyl ester carboxylesterase